MPSPIHPISRRRLAGRGLFLSLLAIGLGFGLALGWASRWAGAAATEPGAAAPASTDQGPPVGGEAAGSESWLPVLNFEGRQDVCISSIQAQNIGADFAIPILITLGNQLPGGSASDVRGVECGGLLRPGDAWTFQTAQIPTGSFSGVIYSFNPRRLSELGLNPGFDDVAADFLCQRLAGDLKASPDAFRRFAIAYRTGGVWAGVPLDRARGARLGVTALRHCPGDRQLGINVASSYAALPPHEVIAPGVPLEYAVGPVHHNDDGVNSRVYIQNMGLSFTSFSLYFQDTGACGAPRLCGWQSAPPGQTVVVEPSDCLASAKTGLLWVTSYEPLAIVAEAVGKDGLANHAAIPVATGGYGEPIVDAQGPTLFAPLLFLDDAEADAELRLFVQNLSTAAQARVRITLLDAAGAVIAGEEATICAQSQHAFSHSFAGGPASTVPAFGSVRVESLAVAPAGPARIGAVAELVQTDRALGQVDQVHAITLLPESQVSAWPPRSDSDGAALLALHHWDQQGWGSDIYSSIILTNAVAEPGRTDYVVLAYDQNALVGLQCGSLGPAETDYFDLQPATMSMARGFRGTAIISATAWTHQAPAGAGAGPVVGLAGLNLVRRDRGAGRDSTGDELAAVLAHRLPRGALPAVTGGRVKARDNAPAGLSAPLCPGGVLPPQPLPVPLPVPPGADLAELHLPIVTIQGQDMVCRGELEVANTGTEPSQAILVAWDEYGFGPPNCRGPIHVECSGLIAPGAAWSLEIYGDFASASLYSVSGRTLAELGIDPASSQTAGDRVCDALKSTVIGDCDVQRRFEHAFRTGGSFGGIPLARAYGAPLTARLNRICPHSSIPGAEAQDDYAAIPHRDTILAQGGSDPANGAYAYAIPEAISDRGGVRSIVYIQNVGTAATGATLGFKAHGSEAVSGCHLTWLAPGEVYPFATWRCIGPEWIGSIVVTSRQPLALIVEDQAGVFVTRGAFAGRLAFDVNNDGRVDGADLALIENASGATPGDPRWNPRLDLNFDGIIDAADRDMLLRYLGMPPAPTATPTGPDPTPKPSATPSTTPSATPDPTATPSPTPRSPVLYLPLCDLSDRARRASAPGR